MLQQNISWQPLDNNMYLRRVKPELVNALMEEFHDNHLTTVCTYIVSSQSYLTYQYYNKIFHDNHLTTMYTYIVSSQS